MTDETIPSVNGHRPETTTLQTIERTRVIRDHHSNQLAEVEMYSHTVSNDWLDVLGPRVRLLTKDTVGDSYSILLGAMPSGAVVPLHRHEDRETFYVLHGAIEGFLDGVWLELQCGDVLDIPGNQMHAWRNTSDSEVQMIIVTTERLADFFREVGEPIGEKQPSSPMERISVFVSAAERYGHHMASPAENEAIGLRVA